MVKQVRVPLTILYLLSFALAALFWKWKGGIDPNAPLTFFLFTVVYMWLPGIVALLFAKKESVSLPIFHRFNRYYLYAPLYALALSFIAFFGTLILGTWNPHLHQNQMGLVVYVSVGLILALTLYALLSLGEELFWRGYLHEKLKDFGPLKASLLIGLVWGIWGAPLILFKSNYPLHPLLGVVMGCVITLTSSPFLFYLREKGKAIFVPALFRGVVTVFSSLTFVFFINPNYFILGTTGFVGAVLFIVFSYFGLRTMKNTSFHD